MLSIQTFRGPPLESRSRSRTTELYYIVVANRPISIRETVESTYETVSLCPQIGDIYIYGDVFRQDGLTSASK